MSAECPECAAAVAFENVTKGEIIVCKECGAELEVLSLAPVTLALAPQEEEDWGE